jgi:hypothetical protein
VCSENDLPLARTMNVEYDERAEIKQSETEPTRVHTYILTNEHETQTTFFIVFILDLFNLDKKDAKSDSHESESLKFSSDFFDMNTSKNC